jgi:hypothetical protein
VCTHTTPRNTLLHPESRGYATKHTHMNTHESISNRHCTSVEGLPQRLTINPKKATRTKVPHLQKVQTDTPNRMNGHRLLCGIRHRGSRRMKQGSQRRRQTGHKAVTQRRGACAEMKNSLHGAPQSSQRKNKRQRT